MQANEIAEFKQQLLAAINDLAVRRRDVEQLSSKHEQLSRAVAAVQATVQNVGEKVSSLTQPAPAHVEPRKYGSIPKPEIAQRRAHVRLVPGADIRTSYSLQ
jgi:hypothetical protein